MKTLMFAVLMLFVFPAHAEDPVKLCRSIGNVAGTIMEARQSGMDQWKISTLVRAMGNPDAQGLVDKIVTAAYETPVMRTSTQQRSAVRIFSTAWELACLDVVSDSI